MEPVDILKNGIEIEIIGCGFADTTVFAIIDNLAGTEAATSFKIVNTYTFSTSYNIRSINAIFLQVTARTVVLTRVPAPMVRVKL